MCIGIEVIFRANDFANYKDTSSLLRATKQQRLHPPLSIQPITSLYELRDGIRIKNDTGSKGLPI
jgi:hypothetical protein